jgi:hypothetical protein
MEYAPDTLHHAELLEQEPLLLINNYSSYVVLGRYANVCLH